jgi:succinate dehydrogenase/fumarate reductase cytochrome b subunit
LNAAIPPSVQSPAQTTSAFIPGAGLPARGLALNSRRLLASVFSLIAGVLAAASTALGWWAVSATGGSGATIWFLPGSSLAATVGGSSETVTYASVQLGPVEALYEAVLAIAIVLAIFALVVGILLLLSAIGKIRNPARYTTLRNLIVVVTIVSLFLVVMVPALQETAISRSGNTGAGLCDLATSSTNPCTAFWGSSASGGNNYSWGADVGWYLVLSATILLAVGFYLWRSARMAPWGSAGQPLAGAPAGALTPMTSGGPATPVDRLLQAKALADSGQLTPAEFEEVKGRLLSQVSASEAGAGASIAPGDELAKLKSLHDSGAVSDAEYAELRKKVLLRF